MVGYAASHVFSSREIDLLEQAESIVARIREDPDLRCHEVARIVSVLLAVGEVQDGLYLASPKGVPAEHSWILLDHPMADHVLDVYAVGRLPMVQLVDIDLPLMSPYAAGPRRQDIRQGLVDRIVAEMGNR